MSKTILVVDDDNDVKESSQVLLMDEGFDVALACDGRIGIEQFEKNNPDITFLDVSGGFHLLREGGKENF